MYFCPDILDIIEDYIDDKELRLVNHNFYDMLKVFPKKISECHNCHKKMINKKSIHLWKGCIYCLEKGICGECGRYNNLSEEEACADYNCCFKYICYDECKYICEICKNVYNDCEQVFVLEDNKEESYKKFVCNNCNKDESLTCPKLWWGLSPEEYWKKYG